MIKRAKREQTAKQHDLFGARQDLPQAAEPAAAYEPEFAEDE